MVLNAKWAYISRLPSKAYCSRSYGLNIPAGGMDEGGWGSRNPGRSQSPGLSRMMSENIGHRYPNVANPRRQYSEDLYDAPRGSLNLLSGPGASPLDIMLGEADLGRPAQPQVGFQILLHLCFVIYGAARLTHTLSCKLSLFTSLRVGEEA